MADWNSFEAFLSEAQAAPNDQARVALVDELMAARPSWPWVEADKATFVLRRAGTTSAALNLDTLPGDPPFAPMTQLRGTHLWHVTVPFQPDDLLDYMIVIDDPMTPLAGDRDLAGRVARHWGIDALNPLKMTTAQMDVSVLRMPEARPFPDWGSFARVPRGRVFEYGLTSSELGFSGRRLWVYIPPDYNSTSTYPLLVLTDGQWASGPLQVPQIADALIKHGRMQPSVIAMIQSAEGAARTAEYFDAEKFTVFLLTELVPYVQARFYINSARIGIGGVAEGAHAAIAAALRSPSLFNHLMAISPPLAGRGPLAEPMQDIMRRLQTSVIMPQRIFQSVGRYETRARFLRPAREVRGWLANRRDVQYRFAETGSGHSLVGFRSVLPEALAWMFPGTAAR
jgi:enterochelin esterase-like enzyme